MKKFVVLCGVLIASGFVGCSENRTDSIGTAVQNPVVPVEQAQNSGWLTATESKGPKLDEETKQKLRTQKHTKHRFSNALEVTFHHENSGDVSVNEGHILVSRIDELPEIVERYEQAIEKKDKGLTGKGVGLDPNGCSAWFIGCIRPTSWAVWSQNVIPYVVDNTFTGAERTALEGRINRWNNSGVILKLRPKVTNESFVRFVRATSLANGASGDSYVGNMGFRWAGVGDFTGQSINLVDQSDFVFSHEVGHAAGLWHEQQRCDQNTFLSGVTEASHCGTDAIQYGRFDYSSVMLYSSANAVSNPPSGQYRGVPNENYPQGWLSSGDNFAINAIYGLSHPPKQSGVVYQGHVQNTGWQGWVGNNAIAGTTGQSKNLEAFRIDTSGVKPGVELVYQAYVPNIGWMSEQIGGIAGTTGQGRPLEAFKIRVKSSAAVPTPTCSLSYRAHVSGIGWQAWVGAGVLAGTTGQGKWIEALQIQFSCS
jgi:Clostridial hydrophobic W/Astacin (Peptidase family M12A)